MKNTQRLLVVLVLLGLACGVDRKKFKTCSQSSFCERNRKFSAESPAPAFAITKAESVRVSSHAMNIQVERPSEGRSLDMEVTGVEGGIIRVRLDEADSPYKRYRAEDALVPGLKTERVVYRPKPRTVSVGKNSKVKVHFEPFSLEFFSGKESALLVNERQMMNFEFWRAKGAEDTWEETFDTHKDTRPNGPTSVGVDVTFTRASHVYGIPTHTTDFALPATRGAKAAFEEPYRMYNLDVFEYEINNTMALYGHVPFMVGHSADTTVGFLWLNAAETWIDVDHDDEARTRTHWMSESGVMDMFFLPGPTPKDVARQYAALTGTTPVPPVFSIAYHQCKWNYKNEEDVATVDATFDAHDIPYDVLWLDIEHTDGKRYFTWDDMHFPTPEKMLKGLAAKGRHMVTIVDPHLKRDADYATHKEAESKGMYVKDRDGNDYDGWCWPGSSSWPDFSQSAVREWWATLFRYERYEHSTPTLFTWNDMNEPSVFNGPEVTMHKDAKHGEWEHRDLHNLYGAYLHEATAMGQTQRNDPPNERPFVLSRAFFAGSQRHGAIWTGDNAAEWSHLASTQPMLLSLQVAGITFSGADVGGFFGDPSAELITRWYQAGALQPFFRGHAHLDSKRREPWLFGEPYTSVIAEAIRMRYALLPYLYTLFHESSTGGLPVMRPLWMEWPAEEASFGRQEEFLLGPSLLVHPVVEEGATQVDVYLPAATNWYDYHTLMPATAGVHQVTLERIPIFLAGGSIVPRKDRKRRSSTQMRGDPYTLVVALDAKQSATGSLYIDDGHSFDYKRGEFAERQLRFEARSLTSTGTRWESCPNKVERVIIAGWKGGRVKGVTAEAGGEKRPLEYKQVGDRITIRKPEVYAGDDFEITLEQ